MSVKKVDTTADEISIVYSRAEKQLRQLIAEAWKKRDIATANMLASQRGHLLEVLTELHQSSEPRWVNLIRYSWETGLELVKAPGVDNLEIPDPYQVEALVKAVQDKNVDVIKTIGRRVDEQLRQIQIEAQLEKQLQGLTTDEATKRLSARFKRLADNGIHLNGRSDIKQIQIYQDRTTFVQIKCVDDKIRNYNLDSYSRMVIRTTSHEAMSRATEAQMKANGQHLVRISVHKDIDGYDICNRYEGKVYTIDPKKASVLRPLLPQWPPFHPNCSHYAYAIGT